MPNKVGRKAWLLAVLIAVHYAPGGLQPAYGYACGRESLRIYPPSGEIPTNAELRVVFPRDTVALYLLDDRRQVLRQAELTIKSPRFSLRSAQGESVALRASQLPGPHLATFLLELRQPLQPDTVYELQAGDANSDIQFPIAHYKTGAGPDSTSPALTRPAARTPATPKSGGRPKPDSQLVQRVRYYHLSHAGYKEAYGPWLELAVSATDDGGPVYYELLERTLGAETLLATGQPKSGELLVFGRWDICRASELEFPAAGTLALSVRAVDRAGHVSTSAVFTVDVSHPQRKR